MKSNVILGSGLTSLLCKKILGSNWKIIPLAPSRFYSKGVPALGDDFVVYDKSVLEIINNWGLNTTPLFYNRPYSISGSLIYNDAFSDSYLNKIGLESNRQIIDYYKTSFTVFGFSCIQLWNSLLKEFISEIKNFQVQYPNYKTAKTIYNNTIILNSGEIIEYDNMISTIPYHKLCEMLNIKFGGIMEDIYYYYVEDNNIDLENSNQVLVCDESIPFHKCTKISKNKYLFEIIGEYYPNIQEELSTILGHEFDILSGAMVENGHVLPYKINKPLLNEQNIICIGSYAQCDPLIDIGSSIKRVYNLLKRNEIKQ